MITDRPTAEKISQIMLEVSSLLNEAAAVMASSNCSDEEKIALYKYVGQLMGTIGLDVLNKIYRTHPAIKPPDYVLPEQL